MQAVITGASSGLGAEFARQLDAMGYETVLVARRREQLETLRHTLTNKSEVVCMDLAVPENAQKLFERFPEADILINNAGFGLFGAFRESDPAVLERMIATNVTAATVLLRLYGEAFTARGSGYILNTASSAAFMAGPYFALYYASKSYLLRLSQALACEWKPLGVTVSALCPGSVATEFNLRAGTTSSTKPISAQKCVQYALKKLFAGKAIIIPTAKMRAAFVMSKLMPESWLTAFSCRVQTKRMKEK
ncbi:MAG: SDR family NAD(P)-dependent oxidoreductase [Clostridia bacterium]|nr:SDR family NAD(P)-dependent oxidoreductase [Clostridia bacterium]